MTSVAHDTLHAALAAAVADLARLAGDAPPDALLDLVAVEPLARRAGCPPRWFVDAARRGTFAPLIRLSERAHFVRRADLLAWARRAELGAARDAAVAAHLDDTPVEPFAEMTAAAPRKTRKRSDRAAEAAAERSAATRGTP